MACVTLKRPLDLDPLEALHSPNRPATKRRRCTPLKGADRESTMFSHIASPTTPSVFRESPLSPSEIACQLRDELKRMRRRRQLVSQEMSPRPARHSPSPPLDSLVAGGGSGVSSGGSGGGGAGRSSSSSSSGQYGVEVMMDSSDPHLRSSSSPLLKSSMEKPVFTLKQMTLICERMCQERADKVRAEYDHILQQKLSEQYDAFVKFIDHQIEQRFNQSQLPSYLS